MELVARNITKSFGPTKAVDNVSVTFAAGQVRAIVGENGAGKSTLLKTLAAVHKKDSGEVSLNGKKYEPESLHDASKSGVTIVFQETTINPYLSIAENIFIDRLRDFKKPSGLINWKSINSAAQRILDDMEADVNVNEDIWKLDLGQWKIIEIARALSYNPKVLFLDESTAFLNTKEVNAFLSVVEKLKSRGMAIGFVSHHMNEVFKIADTITVMKDGKWVCDCKIGEVTSSEIEALMVGREIGENIYPIGRNSFSKETILSLENLTVREQLYGITLNLRKGEILGIGGLKGSGGECILQAIYGDVPFESGRILIDGQEFHPQKPYDALEKGIALVPGERTLEGLIVDFSVMSNISMAALPLKGLLIDKSKEMDMTKKYIADLKIRASGPEVPCSSLSGGNLQKVVIAKCLATLPKILLLNNPTRGIDIGARLEIYRLISELAQEGLSIILLSEDLPELINMSDRIVIMRKGCISKTFTKEENPSEEDIICYML